ncbi:hypothetical protein D3C76_1009290 [compost metagenome]|uniref:hypothetical protein n=1 Tax=Pseudomonas sp. GM84 TaxID=1144340 RepID=UPI00026FB610|nr:hypothetical protein [Pseudomonas sp. GM84]EJN37556.1 hypothetical protein PMI38_02981 [Pseudomonas sp. GM84]
MSTDPRKQGGLNPDDPTPSDPVENDPLMDDDLEDDEDGKKQENVDEGMGTPRE